MESIDFKYGAPKKYFNSRVSKISSELTAHVQERLNNGESLKDIFDDVYGFKEGFTVVKLNDKYNHINKEGKILSPNQWFDTAWSFKEGFAGVRLNDKWNWINKKGEYLSHNQWFDNVGDFINGLAKVNLDGKGCNFINKECEYLLPNQWFDCVYNFYNGVAPVKLNKKWNFINTEGEYLLPNQWFNNLYYHYKEGIAEVELKGKWFDIDLNSLLYDRDRNKVNLGMQESKKYNSKRNVIRLTENDLHRVIKESVKKVLREYN